MMTITLTPELEAAVRERAIRKGITSERLALEELNKLFLGSSHENAGTPWEQLIHRYQSLVDKEFTLGLTEDEATEYERLGSEIDDTESSLINHILPKSTIGNKRL